MAWDHEVGGILVYGMAGITRVGTRGAPSLTRVNLHPILHHHWQANALY